MSYIFLVKDQLANFLCSLQDLLTAKHDVTKETLPTKIPILMSDGLVSINIKQVEDSSPLFHLSWIHSSHH